MSAIEILVNKIPKDKLNNLPTDERSLIICAGHILNEISIFERLGLLSSESDNVYNGEAQRVILGQTITLVRVLAGKLYEAWQFYRDNVFFNKTLKAKFFNENKDSWDKLNIYFNNKNQIKNMRNLFSFHYDTKIIDKNYDNCDFVGDWEVFLSTKDVNTYFAFSESIISQISFSREGVNENEAVNSFFEELFEMSKHIQILYKHILLETIENLMVYDRDIVIKYPIDIKDIKLPYFMYVSPPKKM